MPYATSYTVSLGLKPPANGIYYFRVTLLDEDTQRFGYSAVVAFNTHGIVKTH